MSQDEKVGHLEAARILGISPAALYNYRSLGVAPPSTRVRTKGQKGPPRILYSVPDLLAWKAASTCPTCGQHVPMHHRAAPRELG